MSRPIHARFLPLALSCLFAAQLACQKDSPGSQSPSEATASATPRNAPAGIYFPNLGKHSAGELIANKYLEWRQSFVHDIELDGETYTIVAMGPKDQAQNFGDEEGARNRWNTTTSEAIGYGLFALADAALDGRGDGAEQALFDKMWRFALKNPSPASEAQDGVSLMAWLWDPGGKNFEKWQADPEGAKRFLGNASDGDIWMAAGLIRAHQVWGSEGAVNYEQAANSLLELIKKYNIGPNSKLVTLGDWVRPDVPVQASSPNCEITDQTPGEYVTRSSDFVWMLFQEFYDFNQDQTWLEVIDATQNAVARVQANNDTKLVPDILLVNGENVKGAQYDVFCDSTESGLHHFGWNAVRAPTWWMWHAIDAHGTERGNKTLDILKGMSAWLQSEGIDSHDDVGYEYDVHSGAPKGKEYNPTIFITAFNAALMAETDDAKGSHKSVDRMFKYLSGASLNEWYFDSTVLLLGLEPLTGELSASR